MTGQLWPVSVDDGERDGIIACFDWQEPGASACPGQRLRLVKPSLAGMKAMQVVFASIQQRLTG
jgi:hypothetical protein